VELTVIELMSTPRLQHLAREGLVREVLRRVNDYRARHPNLSVGQPQLVAGALTRGKRIIPAAMRQVVDDVCRQFHLANVDNNQNKYSGNLFQRYINESTTEGAHFLVTNLNARQRYDVYRRWLRNYRPVLFHHFDGMSVDIFDQVSPRTEEEEDEDTGEEEQVDDGMSEDIFNKRSDRSDDTDDNNPPNLGFAATLVVQA
jgi:hypothetical protein